MALPEIKIRIAFDTDPFDASPVWTDVSADAMSYSIRRGRQHELDRVEAGTATIVLNNQSGNYWPNNTSGDYYPDILPGKRINIRVTYDGNTYDRFTGFIEKWQPGFISQPLKGAIMTLTCADLTKNLAKLLLNGTGYSAELSGTRVSNVLDDLGWPSGERDIDTGQSTILATGTLSNVNALEHLFNVASAERGIFFQSTDGKLVYQDRHARFKAPYSTSQATFGDGSGEMPFTNIELAYDDQYIYNDIRITRTGGTEQTAEDTTSQQSFGKRSLARSELLVSSDGECLSQAQYLLSQYKDPALRARNIIIANGANLSALCPKTFSYDISTRITVNLDQADISGDYHIEGINEDWNASQPEKRAVVTSWQLSNADAVSYWAWGYAKWGSSKWAY